MRNSSASNGRNPAVLAQQCTNFSGANIYANRLVSRWNASTDATAGIKADENALGVVIPTTAYNRFLGVLDARGRPYLENGQDGTVVRGGRARLLVRVPASINLPVGTGLVPATFWDGTDDVVEIGGDASALNAGCAEPVIKNSIIYAPANPIAWLAAPLTATSAVTYQVADVEVDYDHRMTFHTQVIPLTTPANLTLLALIPFGPGVLHSVGLFATDFTGTGDFTLDINQCPLGTITDVEAMLTTALSVQSTGTPSDGVVALTDKGGTTGLCSSSGDTDSNVAMGTAGSNGVLAAATRKTFTDKSILQAVISGTPASMLNAYIHLNYWYL